MPYEELANIIYPKPKYSLFTIKKKNGGLRVIQAPSANVKKLQHIIIEKILKDKIIPRPSAHGFVNHKSIVTNARIHIGKNFVFNLDLENFFQSISFNRVRDRVRGIFKGSPFGYSDNIAICLAHICCYEGKLPQGAPTSPILSNIVCRSLDYKLQQLAKHNKSTYTRYCDDITFSFTSPRISAISNLIVDASAENIGVGTKLESIIIENGFSINKRKTRIYSKKSRMEVTGLTVNKFPNIQRKSIDRIRAILHCWESYGYKTAQENYLKFIKKEKKLSRTNNFLFYTRGYLSFLRSVKGANDQVYRKLASKFNYLSKIEFDEKSKPLHIDHEVRNENNLKDAIFIISAENSAGEMQQGTAFYLKDVGFVTCDHVRWIKEDKKPTDEFEGYFFPNEIIILNNKEQKVCDVKIKKYDANKDYLILEPIKIEIEPMFLKHSTELPKLSEELFLCGYPSPFIYNQTLTIFKTSLATTFNTFGADHIEIATQIRKGNSGGPLLNSKFEVIGIAKTGSEQSGGKNSVLCINEIFY